jgi:hypothetical protein
MPRLEGYRFGRLVVDGEEQTRDLIVLPKRVVTNWWRADGDRLVLEELKEVRGDLPSIWSLVPARRGRCAPIRRRLTSCSLKVSRSRHCQTAEAVRRYGELDPRRTAAALHLTC